MDLQIQFKNTAQQQFYFCTDRNQCFSGGFNNGKTYAACLKAVTLLLTFPNYRIVIAREMYTDLKKTTMQTFFKIIPQSMIETHSIQDGLTRLKNGSVVFWMHLDSFDEQSLRGLEINSVIVDQAEEIEENIYLVLDSRVGRWDKALVPQHLKDEYVKTNGKEWPRTALGHDKVPTYMIVLCNPDTQFHWIYRRYHKDSLEHIPRHIMIESETDANLGDPETIKQMFSRDPEWVSRYVKGLWGTSSAQIHYLPPECILPADPKLIDNIKRHGNLFRVLDHGDSAPTCCLWFAVLNGNYICYREYYSPGQLVSHHRKSLAELSEGETYTSNYADPSIFYKSSQKDGGFWSIADEYMTNDIDAPPITFLPADNNEYATRNRINELLSSSNPTSHPLTQESPSPRLYFIQKSPDYPFGCYHAITQLQAQRRRLLSYDNGKPIYLDDRDDRVTDHAYDPTRYFVSMHGLSKSIPQRTPPKGSFAWYKQLARRPKVAHAASIN